MARAISDDFEKVAALLGGDVAIDPNLATVAKIDLDKTTTLH